EFVADVVDPVDPKIFEQEKRQPQRRGRRERGQGRAGGFGIFREHEGDDPEIDDRRHHGYFDAEFDLRGQFVRRVIRQHTCYTITRMQELLTLVVAHPYSDVEIFMSLWGAFGVIMFSWGLCSFV